MSKTPTIDQQGEVEDLVGEERSSQTTAIVDSTRVPEPLSGETITGASKPDSILTATGAADQHSSWKPDPTLLASIAALGFSDICAEKALFYTGNTSADAAVGWILDNPGAETDVTPLALEGAAVESGSSSSSPSTSPVAGSGATTADVMFKMVLVVNMSLKMGLGKIAAQVAHATLGLYRSMAQRSSCVEPLALWREYGEKTVVLRGEDEAELLTLQRSASTAGLGVYLVHDAGRTQVAAGSATVLAVFGPVGTVDRVTGQLKLL